MMGSKKEADKGGQVGRSEETGISRGHNKISEEEKLLRIYELEITRENYWVIEHQKRIGFCVGLLSALIGGTLAGLLQADRWYYWVLLMIGPVLIMCVAKTGRKAVDRLYQRWLETITTLMKIEEDLGLSKARNRAPEESGNWVANEQFVPERHMASRRKAEYRSSGEWVDKHRKMESTYQGATNKLFVYAWRLGWVLLVGILVIGVGKLIRQEGGFFVNLFDKLCKWRLG